MADHASLDLLRLFVCLSRSKERCELLSADEQPLPPEIDHKTLLLCNCNPRSDKSLMYSETRQTRYALRYMKEVGEGVRPVPTKAQWKKFATLVAEQLGDMDNDTFDDVSDMDGDDSEADEDEEPDEEPDDEDEGEEDEAAAEEAEGEEAEGEEEDDADDADFEPAEEGEDEEAEDDDEADGEEDEGEEEEDDEEAAAAPPPKRKRASA